MPDSATVPTVAICVPPASPHVTITVRRFGKRAFTAAQLVEQGALPEHIRAAAARTLHTRRNILVSGGTGSGKTTLLNALIELLPDDERIVAIEDTLELCIDSPNCARFEARGLQKGAVTIRDLVKHALRHRPDHIVVGEVRGGEAADLLQALNTGHGGSLTTVHANNAESALSPRGELRHARRRRSPVGGDVSRRGRWHRHGDPHDARRRPALCRRSGVRAWLRRREERMGHRTTRPHATLKACRIRWYAVALAVLTWLAGAPVLAQTGTAHVDRVIDGDTISVRLDGARCTVRLTGVDTPETTHPTRGVEPDGPDAADYTTARLTGATVRLDLDPAGDDQDADGRILRYVMLASGEHVNATLIRDGYATAIRRFPTPGNANFYSWKPRRAARAEGYGRADDHHRHATAP